MKKTIFIKIIIRNAGEAFLESEVHTDTLSYGDPNLIVIRPQDVSTLGVDFVSDCFGYDDETTIKQIAIYGSRKSQVDISPLLLAVKDRLSEGARVSVEHCYVRSTLFHHLLAYWSEVAISGCTIGHGWWNSSSFKNEGIPFEDRKCERLYAERCNFAPAPRINVGQCAHPNLKWLTVDEGHWDRALHSLDCFEPKPYVAHQSKYGHAPFEFLKAFFGDHLKMLSIFDWSDTSRLTELPSLPALHDLCIKGSDVYAETLEWITTHPKIRYLDLSWRRGSPSLPWQHLSKLKKLRGIEVSETSCSDDDLKEILRHTRLRRLDLYYSETTPAAWAMILASKTLRHVLVSDHSLVGNFDEAFLVDLPESTTLLSCTTINVSNRGARNLRRLMAKYPAVQLDLQDHEGTSEWEWSGPGTMIFTGNVTT